MPGADQDDPFLWDEDRVVLELCTPNGSWPAPPAKKMPDPAALEAKLRECGVDGESLLTYEDEFGFPSLWEHLNIRKFPHQLSLKDAITHFRKRSRKYQEWKAKQLAEDQASDHEDSDSRIKSKSHTLADPELSTKASPVPAPCSEAETRDHTELRPALPELAIPSQGALTPSLSPASEPMTSALQAPHVPHADQLLVQEPPLKKRRIAPTAISNRPTLTAAAIPTEADIFMRTAHEGAEADISMTGTPEGFLKTADSSGFLGTSYLLLDRLINPDAAVGTNLSEDEFILTRHSVPPGRRLQVSAVMKRFLRLHPVGRMEVLQNAENMSLFGESDDESVDSETWREYQEEEKERLAMEALAKSTKARILSEDRVREAIADCIRELESRWLVEKKPRYDRKAWKIWQDARRNPDRLALINSAKEFLGKLDVRIERISEEILTTQWTIDEDVGKMFSGFLETNVFEKKYQSWFIDILESPRQPPKPSSLPKAVPKVTKPRVLDNEESLSSDSDDIDDFIEYDDNPVVNPPADEMEIDSDLAPAQGGSSSGPSVGGSTHNELLLRQSTLSSESDDNALPQPMTTPKKVRSEKELAPETPRLVVNSASEPIVISSSPSPVKDTNPGFDDFESLEEIGEKGTSHWEQIRDAERLVVAVLYEWSSTRRARIADAIRDRDHDEVWATYIQPTIEQPESVTSGSVEVDLARLFSTFIKRRVPATMRKITYQIIHRESRLFPAFCTHLQAIMPKFLSTSSRTPTRIVLKTPSKKATSRSQASTDEAKSTDSDEPSSSDDVPAPAPAAKKRRRHKRRDRTAANLRMDHFKTMEEHARRALRMREKLAESGSVPSDKSRLIVNETKESDELGLIYINDDIGRRIKDHQIEGVRFMWNQVVVESKVRQGCLLAHTMGLGKTMQVITLLVVIAEASASPDPTIRSQIPKELRQSKTLVLCPAGLVENWFEEIIKWAPPNLLGCVRKMDATLPAAERTRAVREWAASGGVLIIGYSLFTGLVRGDEETARLLQETPNLVIGDEAHFLKNPDSQRHQAAANFRTMSRIAMTGSPLTNNVMDYYAMINWVAPNYLADIAEFRERFANPIKEGLYADSDPYLKRKARKQLQVLKETVGPKVHRRDIQVLVNEIPTKKEFILSLPLTKLQMRLYETYIDWVVNSGATQMISSQARVWSLVSTLGLVLAHPFIFKSVAEEEKRNGGGSSSKMAKAGADNGEADEEKIELPQDVLIKMLATVAVREIEDYALSNKIVVLLRILDECRKVGDKVLIFSQRIPTLTFLENIFKRQRVAYQRLDGKTPASERQKSIKKFNTDVNSGVYLISTKAGGLGLNIYGANRVVIFDFNYTPSDEQQAIGRAYRLGQTKPVYVYWLTVGGTFEDTIHNHAIFKTQLASRVVDKKNPNPYSTRFAEYFTMPKIPEQQDLSKAFGQDQVLDALLKNDGTGKLIRKITSTETFEKEETYELTAEDQLEVKENIELERLRITNPEEYKRREHERLWQSRTELGMPPPPFTLTQPRHADTLVNPVRPANPFISSSFPRLPTSSAVSPQPLAGKSTASMAEDATTTKQDEPNGTLIQHATADLQPILGTGTHFKTGHGSAPSARQGGPSNLSFPSTSSPFTGVPTLRIDFEELSNLHKRLYQEGRRVRISPSEFFHKVETALVQGTTEKLPLLDKLQNVQKYSRDPRFAEAMLAGHIEPEQLAAMTRAEMDEMTTSLNAMADADFKQLVWTTKADLSQLSSRSRAMERRRLMTDGSDGPGGGGGGGEGGGGRGGGGKSRLALLRFIGGSSRERSPATPPQDGRALQPGDSAESPHIID
ncbi:hypothetical protein VTK26DRAFT_5670 [Humicola hyalothermophila]